MNYAVALGGNIGDTKRIFAEALALINAGIGTIDRKSSFYETPPLLHPQTPTLGQRDYLNAVILVRSSLNPAEVLAALLDIETTLGRERNPDTPRWGPRTIDLDIVAAENLIINTTTLVIPHPEMHRRKFVLEPMLEVCPDWEHPVLKKTVRQLYDLLPAGEETT